MKRAFFSFSIGWWPGMALDWSAAVRKQVVRQGTFDLIGASATWLEAIIGDTVANSKRRLSATLEGRIGRG